MEKNKKLIIILFVILNAVVLLGQIFPEGTPPFARTINIITLVLNIVLFIVLLAQKQK